MRRDVTRAAVVLAILQAAAWGQAPAGDDGANKTTVPLERAEAKPQAAVPVKQVVLFSSGVGYFEHAGTIKGDGSTELQFKTGQINDILKSLVLQDLDGGRVAAVTYPSQDPVEKTLKSFQIDITANPSLGDLLNQLRGAEVTLSIQGENVEGVVLGVEKKQVPAEKGVVERAVANVMTETGIRAIPVESVASIQLKDPKLRDELRQALAALSAARDQDKKPVKIAFQGQGDRRVRVGYVVETPVWKTSYRLILGDDVKPQAGRPTQAEVTGPAPATAPAGAAKLQGWAIVENQTDNDWDDVQLSLVSGRPISFVQDLYRPLYIPRPVVRPELYASLTPQQDKGGVAPAAAAPTFDLSARNGAMAKRGSGGGGGGGSLFGSDGAVAATEAESDMDATASVASLTSAGAVGELFQYTVGNVSLARQRSAMIPIVTDDVEVERVSIYNAGVLPRNPLNGVRVKNTTGKHLLAGPVTVLAAGSYAGDARIDDLPPGQERLLSYGVDLQTVVDAEAVNDEGWLLTGKIVKGVLEVSRKLSFVQRYDATNKGDVDRTLVIEHPVRDGWELEETPAPYETTGEVHRFKLAVPAGKQASFTVKQGMTQVEGVGIAAMEPTTLLFYASAKEIPADVRAALAKAADLQRAVAETERKIVDVDKQQADIAKEQGRLRENMKTVDRAGAYYNRLAGKLNDQETQIEAMQTQRAELVKTLEGQRKALEDYVVGLSVG